MISIKEYLYSKPLVFQAIVIALVFHLFLFVLFKNNKENYNVLQNTQPANISIVSKFSPNIKQYNMLLETIKFNDPSFISRPSISSISSIAKHRILPDLEIVKKTNSSFKIREFDIFPEVKTNRTFAENEILPKSIKPIVFKKKSYPLAVDENYKHILNFFKDDIEVVRENLKENTINSTYEVKRIFNNSLPSIRIIESSGNKDLDKIIIGVMFRRYKELDTSWTSKKIKIYWTEK